jgi:hypothetical protein
MAHRRVPSRSGARICGPSVLLSYPWIGAISEVKKDQSLARLPKKRGVP